MSQCLHRRFFNPAGKEKAGVNGLLADLSSYVATGAISGLECLKLERDLKERLRHLRKVKCMVLRCRAEAIRETHYCEKHLEP